MELRAGDAADMGRSETRDINLDAVLDEIRETADGRSFEEIPGFHEMMTGFAEEAEYDPESLRDDIWKMKVGSEIVPDTASGTRGVKGALKKAVWKANNFWAGPAAAEQTWFNTFVARGFIHMEQYISKQQAIIETLQERIARLEQELEHRDKN